MQAMRFRANVDVCMLVFERQKRISRDYAVNHRWPGGLILSSTRSCDHAFCWQEATTEVADAFRVLVG